MPEPSKRRSWRRLLLRWTLLLAGGYLALCLLLYLFQRRVQYVPDPSPVPLPQGPQARGLQEVTLETSDGVSIEAWHWPGTRDVTVLVMHGNAGHRGHRLGWIEALRRHGFGVFIHDWRGYGGSGGSPTEAGLYRDAEAAVRWVEEHTDGPVVYFGESLGSGPAVEMATRHGPAAVILQSAFPSAAEVGSAVYPFLPVRLLLHDRYDIASRIGDVRCPLLFLHGARDRIVPLRLGRRLHAQAPGPKELWVHPTAGHNDLPFTGGAEYWQTIDSFVRRQVEGESPHGSPRGGTAAGGPEGPPEAAEDGPEETGREGGSGR